MVSSPHASLPDLRAEVRHLLREVDGLLRPRGASLLPLSVLDVLPPGDPHEERFQTLSAVLGSDFVRNASCIASDQINVGGPDEEGAFRIFRALVEAIPAFIGLGAASPFRHGVANGVVANRLAYYDDALARFPSLGGPPPILADLDAYFALIDGLPALNRADTYYGYVRPMPHRGVAGEVRCVDKQPTLEGALAFLALAKAVARHALDDGPGLSWPWVATPAIPRPDVTFGQALRHARTRGLPEARACTAVLTRMTDYLPDDERALLDPLTRRTSSGPPAVEMARFAARHGFDGLHRALIRGLRTAWETP